MISRAILISLSILVSSPSYSKPSSHSHGGRTHSHSLPDIGVKHRHNNGQIGYSPEDLTDTFTTDYQTSLQENSEGLFGNGLKALGYNREQLTDTFTTDYQTSLQEHSEELFGKSMNINEIDRLISRDPAAAAKAVGYVVSQGDHRERVSKMLQSNDLEQTKQAQAILRLNGANDVNVTGKYDSNTAQAAKDYIETAKGLSSEVNHYHKGGISSPALKINIKNGSIPIPNAKDIPANMPELKQMAQDLEGSSLSEQAVHFSEYLSNPKNFAQYSAHLKGAYTQGLTQKVSNNSQNEKDSEVLCKELAKSKWENNYEDPKGISFILIYPDKAIPACEKAVAKNPNLLNQTRLVRALSKGKRYKDAFKLNQKISDKQNPMVLSNYGYMYLTGKGVEKDLDKAFKLYKKAANSNYPVAQHAIGYIYQSGDGVEHDFDKALVWYKKAADRGYAASMTYIGFMYQIGEGVEKDLGKALEWFKKAADRRDANAMNSIGYMYRTGQSVETDVHKALEWFKKAANNGSTDAMYNVGNHYSIGIGVVMNREKAIVWYDIAAEMGHAAAQVQLDKMLNENKIIAANERKKRIAANERKRRNPTPAKQTSFGEMLIGLYIQDVKNTWSGKSTTSNKPKIDNTWKQPPINYGETLILLK